MEKKAMKEDTHRISDPNWPKGYSTPKSVMTPVYNWGINWKVH